MLVRAIAHGIEGKITMTTDSFGDVRFKFADEVAVQWLPDVDTEHGTEQMVVLRGRVQQTVSVWPSAPSLPAVTRSSVRPVSSPHDAFRPSKDEPAFVSRQQHQLPRPLRLWHPASTPGGDPADR